MLLDSLSQYLDELEAAVRGLESAYVESYYWEHYIVSIFLAAHCATYVNLKVEQEKPLKVYYDNHVIDDFYVDLLVEQEIIVELKSVQSLPLNPILLLFNRGETSLSFLFNWCAFYRGVLCLLISVSLRNLPPPAPQLRQMVLG